MCVFYVDKNDKKRDKGLVDEMLENEEEITQELIEAGIIRPIHIQLGNLSDLPPELQQRYSEMVKKGQWFAPEYEEEAAELQAEMDFYRSLPC